MMNPSLLSSLLEKASSWDKDERYMASSDLCSLLGGEYKFDEVNEQKICAVVLKQLGKLDSFLLTQHFT